MSSARLALVGHFPVVGYFSDRLWDAGDLVGLLEAQEMVERGKAA